MFDAVSASFRWLLTLGGKFLRVAPGPTLFVIPATLVSQIAMLLAFLLPLKVLIMIGSDGIPRYFPPSLMQFDRDALIVSLSIATPVFYLLHLAMEKLVDRVSNLGAKRLLAQSKKVVLFDNQDDIAASSYRRYAEALANTVFIFCVLLMLGVIYPALCLWLAGYTVFCVVGVGFAYRISHALRERIDESLTSLVPILTALGFLLTFLLLVMQFSSGAAQGFLLAIISLLLTRQALNRTNRLVSAVVNLYGNRRKLNALFFSEHSLSQVDERQEEFWSLFTPQTREGWLRQLLVEQLAIAPNRLSVNWHQTGVNDLVALEVEAYDAGDKLLGRYLVRVYGKSPSLLASHEATLLFDESSEHLPALPLVAAGQVGKWHCHIFSLVDGCVFVKPTKYAERYLTALWAFEPPQDLADRYARSHPMLWQRLDAPLMERLTMAAGEDGYPLVRNLEEHLPSMLATLQGLPLVVFNPDINNNTLKQDAEGELWVTYWGRWTLEPLGSGWLPDQKSLKNLPQGLQLASVRRPALQSVDAQAVILAALLFKFDGLCSKQLYRDALELIPPLLEAAGAGSALTKPWQANE